MNYIENGVRRVKVRIPEESMAKLRSIVGRVKIANLNALVTIAGQPQCLKCQGFGHLRVNCPKPTADPTAYASRASATTSKPDIETEEVIECQEDRPESTKAQSNVNHQNTIVTKEVIQQNLISFGDKFENEKSIKRKSNFQQTNKIYKY